MHFNYFYILNFLNHINDWKASAKVSWLHHPSNQRPRSHQTRLVNLKSSHLGLTKSLKDCPKSIPPELSPSQSLLIHQAVSPFKVKSSATKYWTLLKKIILNYTPSLEMSLPVEDTLYSLLEIMSLLIEIPFLVASVFFSTN